MAVLISSYSESLQNNFTQLGSGGYTDAGNSFTGNGGTLDSAKFFVRKSGSPTGNATARVFAVTGTPGTNATPTGSALATSDNFDVSTLTTSYALITFTFSGANRITLTNATAYFVVITFTGGGGSNWVEPGSGNTSLPVGQNSARNFGGWIASTAVAWCYYVYSASSGPANLKSYNTNLLANIKSINTNLLANIKSLDTNV